MSESSGTATTQRYALGGGLAVDQVLHLDHVGVVFGDPVHAGQPDVQDAAIDIARHLLGAKHQALDLGVVDVGHVRAAGHDDLVARLAKQLDRRFLEASLGQAEFEYVHDQYSPFLR